MALQVPAPATVLGNATYPHRKRHGVLTEVQYAHPDGSNSNDGLSWGTAKADVLGAYDALPSAGGTIYFADSTHVDAVNTDRGLWIVGVHDPNFASPPTGWRQVKAIRLIGVSTQNATGNSKPVASLLAGSSTDTTKPGIWISGTDKGLYFENVWVNGGSSANAILLGKPSTGSTGTNTSGIRFENCAFRTNQVAGLGPAVDLYAAYWVYFRQCTFAGNEQEVYTSDARANILNRGNAAGSGLHWVEDSKFFGGAGYKFNASGLTSTNVLLDGVTQEGTSTGGAVGAPIFWLNGNLGGGLGHAIVRFCESSDRVAGSDVAVRVAAGNSAERVIIQAVPDYVGPCTVLGRYPFRTTVSHAGNDAVGFNDYSIFGSHEGHRRAFGPTAVRYANQAAQDVTTWSSKAGTATVTTGKTAPDGTTGAAELSSGASVDERQVAGFAQTLAVNDWLVGGSWVRTTDSIGVTSGEVVIFSVNPGNNFEGVSSNVKGKLSPFADQAWHWVSVAGKFSAITQASSAVGLALRAEAGHPMQYYAPVMFYISASAGLTDSEVMELSRNLQAYPDGAPVGSVSSLRGQKVIARGGLGIGNSAAATTPGSVIKKMEVFSETGTSLGFVPIYNSIT